MERLSKTLFILILIALSISVKAQKDYIITTNGDSIFNIKITDAPTTVVPETWDCRKNARMVDRDMQIQYTPDGGKQTKILYSLVDRYFYNNTLVKSWHKREMPMVNNLVSFVKVIELPGQTSSQLYEKARDWVIKYYKLQPQILQASLTESKETGSLFMFNVYGVPAWTDHELKQNATEHKYYIIYNVELKVKDGKARIELSNFRYHFEVERLEQIGADKPFVFDKYDKKAEIIVNNLFDVNDNLYSNKNNINYFYYLGRMLISWIPTELVIPDFENSMKKNADW